MEKYDFSEIIELKAQLRKLERDLELSRLETFLARGALKEYAEAVSKQNKNLKTAIFNSIPKEVSIFKRVKGEAQR